MNFMKKLIISTIVLLGISWANVVKAQAELVYAVMIGGECQKLTLIGKDLTGLCRDIFVNMSWNDGEVLYVASVDAENPIMIAFSGHQSEQPRLERYTLFLDSLRIGTEENMMEQNVVGTCEMWGDFLKEKAWHKCLVKNEYGEEIIFEFQSDPKEVEIINL